MRAFVIFLLFVCLSLPEHAAAANPPLPAKSKRKAAPSRTVTIKRPMRPMAGFVPRVEASIQHGCVDSQEVQAAAMRMGIPQGDVEKLFSTLLPLSASPERACVNYAAALLPAGIGSSLAVLESKADRDKDREYKEGLWVTVVHSKPNGMVDSSRESVSTEGWQDLIVPALGIDSGGADGIRGLPYYLQWEAGLLVKHLLTDVDELARHHVRIVLHKPAGEDYDKIVAVELVETATARVIDSVVWLDREDDVGAYFNPKGDNYERLFWEAPVDYTRITRGIGKSAVTIKRRVAVKASGKKKKTFVNRTFRYRGHHVGIDFAVPVGEPVRAVADAVVVFVGPRGGYGNLVVLEHGKNYQTYYAHLSRFTDGLSVGQKILRGEEIGFVGMTGLTTGPHLHFEIRKENQYFDPLAKENNMTLWNLYPEEHAHLLAKIVALNVTRMNRPLPRVGMATLPR